MPLNNLITFRRGSSSEWLTSNTILSSGEPGYDLTNNQLKIGDGLTPWSGLIPVNYNLNNYDIVGSGNINISGDITANNGNFSKLEVDGSFSATTKSFVIKHPSKPDMKLQYGSLESPYHGIRLTGKDSIKDGVCTVFLPDYIKDLVREEDINFQITNYKHHKTLYVDKIDLKNNQITIKGYRCKSLGTLEFFWTFTAVRKDVEPLIVEK